MIDLIVLIQANKSPNLLKSGSCIKDEARKNVRCALGCLVI